MIMIKHSLIKENGDWPATCIVETLEDGVHGTDLPTGVYIAKFIRVDKQDIPEYGVPSADHPHVTMCFSPWFGPDEDGYQMRNF
jgi:hypothetical protein